VRRVGVLVVLVTVAAGGSARAYVRTLNTNTMQPVYWKQTCPTATIYLNGFERSPANGGMSVDAIVKSITAAAHTWSADAVTCPAGGSPFLEIVPTLAPTDAKAPAIGQDARNTIVFRTERWSPSGRADTKGYDVNGLVITTVTSEPDGHIVDVDMEINATDPSMILWMNIDPGVVVPGTKNGDLRSAERPHARVRSLHRARAHVLQPRVCRRDGRCQQFAPARRRSEACGPRLRRHGPAARRHERRHVLQPDVPRDLEAHAVARRRQRRVRDLRAVDVSRSLRARPSGGAGVRRRVPRRIAGATRRRRRVRARCARRDRAPPTSARQRSGSSSSLRPRTDVSPRIGLGATSISFVAAR
jgi:hypothetical protein